MSEYPKIETAFERDDATFKVNPDNLRNSVYSIIREWQWTEKIDGTNIRCIWDAAAGKLTFGGRTDNASIPADSSTKRFAAFDVLVGGKWWLDWENTVDVANKLGMETVPYVGTFALSEAIKLVKDGFGSYIQGSSATAEGLVGRTVEPLFDKRGSRLIIKLKTKDF